MLLPCPGNDILARESKKQAANLPKPPLPKPASVSTSSSSLISYPNSDNPSLTIL